MLEMINQGTISKIKETYGGEFFKWTVKKDVVIHLYYRRYSFNEAVKKELPYTIVYEIYELESAVDSKNSTTITSLDFSELKILRTSYGKPYIAISSDPMPQNPTNQFYFNISNTSQSFVIAFSKSEIGVDMESISDYDFTKDYMNDLIKTSFSLEEQHYCADNSSSFKQKVLEVWTRKESYLKMIGTGMEENPEDLANINTCNFDKSKLFCCITSLLLTGEIISASVLMRT